MARTLPAVLLSLFLSINAAAEGALPVEEFYFGIASHGSNRNESLKLRVKLPFDEPQPAFTAGQALYVWAEGSAHAVTFERYSRHNDPNDRHLIGTNLFFVEDLAIKDYERVIVSPYPFPEQTWQIVAPPDDGTSSTECGHAALHATIKTGSGSFYLAKKPPIATETSGGWDPMPGYALCREGRAEPVSTLEAYEVMPLVDIDGDGFPECTTHELSHTNNFIRLVPEYERLSGFPGM